MTDTVNVPREIVQRLILAADSYGVRYLDSDDMSPEAEELQAATEEAKDALAAAPKAEPNVEVKAIAYVMAHEAAKEMGYPSLTEALEDLDLLRTQPEAPKVEQVPTAWAYRLSFPDENTAWEWEVGKEKMTEEKFGPHGGVLETIPLYAHPAPASDELLDRIHSWLVCAPMVSDVTEYHEMAAQFVEEIAKHKGPQS